VPFEAIAEKLAGRPLTDGDTECADVTEPSGFTVEEIDPTESADPDDDFTDVEIAGTVLYDIVPTDPTDDDCELVWA
jgi:hypothetical protein